MKKKKFYTSYCGPEFKPSKYYCPKCKCRMYWNVKPQCPQCFYVMEGVDSNEQIQSTNAKHNKKNLF